MEKVELAEAKAKLSELVDRAIAGEEIVIARNGVPLVALAPVTERAAIPYGDLIGKVKIVGDLTLPDDIVESFYAIGIPTGH